MTPWNHWHLPTTLPDERSALERGLVLVTVSYRVRSSHAEAFLRTMDDLGRIRRRDGASWWGVFRDLEQADLYLGSFVVASWAEHVRQHERFTLGDRDVETRIRAQVDEEPVVRHYIHADADS